MIRISGYNTEVEEFKRKKEKPTPETISATYARISRSDQPIEVIRKNAKQDVDKARESNYKIVFGLGHSSVAEHAVFNVDFVDVSRAFLEELEYHRLASYTERSQRYVNFGNASFYHPDKELEKEEKEYYQSCLRMYDLLLSKGIDKEDARYFLPLSILSQVGVTANAREWMHIIKSLSCSHLEESRNISKNLLDEFRNISPSLFKYADVDKDSSLHHKYDYSRCKIINEPKREKDYISSFFTFDSFKELNEDGKLRSKFLEKIDCPEFDPLPRELEFFIFPMVLEQSAVCYGQMKRHRMMTFIPKSYTFYGSNYEDLWFPSSIQSLFNNDKEIWMLKNELFNKMVNLINLSKENDREYNSIYYTLGCIRRDVFININLREVMKFIKLRSDPHAQEEIRWIGNYFKENIFLKLKTIFCGK